MSESSINVKEAKARLSELLERARAGDEVVITRHGRPMARLSGAVRPRQPINLESLQALTREMPRSDSDAGALVRRMRDESRY